MFQTHNHGHGLLFVEHKDNPTTTTSNFNVDKSKFSEKNAR